MDGTRRETEPTREVKQRFEGSRSETQLMTASYEWVLPWVRCPNGAEPVHRACGEAAVPSEVRVAMPQCATGA